MTCVNDRDERIHKVNEYFLKPKHHEEYLICFQRFVKR